MGAKKNLLRWESRRKQRFIRTPFKKKENGWLGKGA
jgi:hypothetical protein